MVSSSCGELIFIRKTVVLVEPGDIEGAAGPERFVTRDGRRWHPGVVRHVETQAAKTLTAPRSLAPPDPQVG
jgi:hypothetical protein